MATGYISSLTICAIVDGHFARAFSAFDHGLMDVTPRPPALDRANEGVSGIAKVERGVRAWRGVAAAHVAAAETETQPYPPLAQRETLFTAVGPGSNRPGFSQVTTGFCIHAPTTQRERTGSTASGSMSSLTTCSAPRPCNAPPS